MGRLDLVGYGRGARAGENLERNTGFIIASALAAAEIKHAAEHADQRLNPWFVGGA